MIVQASETARMLCMLLSISGCGNIVYEKHDATQVEELLSRQAPRDLSIQSGVLMPSCLEEAGIEPIELSVLLDNAKAVSRMVYIDYDTDVYSVTDGLTTYLERNPSARVTLVKVAQHVSCSRIANQTDRVAQLSNFRARVTFVHLCNRLAPVPGSEQADLEDFSRLAFVWEFQVSNIYSALEMPASLLNCNLLDVTSDLGPSLSNTSLAAVYHEHANQTTKTTSLSKLLARSLVFCPLVCSRADTAREPALTACLPSGDLSPGATVLLALLVLFTFGQLFILVRAVNSAKLLFQSSEAYYENSVTEYEVPAPRRL